MLMTRKRGKEIIGLMGESYLCFANRLSLTGVFTSIAMKTAYTRRFSKLVKRSQGYQASVESLQEYDYSFKTRQN